MALTAQQIADTLNTMGITDTGKLVAFLAPGKASTDIRRCEKEVEDLRADQAAAAAPFNEQIRPLEIARAEAMRAFQPAIDAKLAEIETLKAQL